MLKWLINKFKNGDTDIKSNFSIDVKRKRHLLEDNDKEYFWMVIRTIDGCSTVYTCGWSKTSNEAWEEANRSYGEITGQSSKGVQKWFDL